MPTRSERTAALPVLLLAVALSVTASGTSAAASSRATGPHPDAPPQTSQYGFFIGSWDCTIRSMQLDGKPGPSSRATWTAYYILDGWAIQDEWIGEQPDGSRSYGTNIRSFNPQTDHWDNRWLAQGNLQWKYFRSDQKGDTMVMVGGEGKDPRGEFVDRNTFYDIQADSWKWRKDRSWDGGETWLEGIAHIDARRRKPATAPAATSAPARPAAIEPGDDP